MLSRTGVPPGDKCGVQRLVPGLWGRRGAPFPPRATARGCAPTGRTAPAAGGAVTSDPPARPGCVSRLRAAPSSLLTPRAGLREPRASPGSRELLVSLTASSASRLQRVFRRARLLLHVRRQPGEEEALALRDGDQRR